MTDISAPHFGCSFVCERLWRVHVCVHACWFRKPPQHREADTRGPRWV